MKTLDVVCPDCGVSFTIEGIGRSVAKQTAACDGCGAEHSVADFIGENEHRANVLHAEQEAKAAEARRVSNEKLDRKLEEDRAVGEAMALAASKDRKRKEAEKRAAWAGQGCHRCGSKTISQTEVGTDARAHLTSHAYTSAIRRNLNPEARS